LKFEQLLKIYWSRGFLYGGKTQSFNSTLYEFFADKPGLATTSLKLLVKRFELNHFKKTETSFLTLTLDSRKIINMYLSQLISINSDINDLIRYNLIRLYLIRTHRGRSHALGKPTRGQRTWSNAWTANRCNIIVKQFISDVKKFNFIEKKPEPLRFNRLKKKIKKKAPRIKMVFTKKRKNLWF
jgi:ribosomal protein S13